MAETKTFQEEHRLVFIAALFLGFPPPGIELMVPGLVIKVFQVLKFIPAGLAAVYVGGMVHLILFNPPSSLIVNIQMFRRVVSASFLAFRPCLYYLKMDQMTELFDDWNFNINKNYCVQERKALLKISLKELNRVVWWVFLFRFTVLNVYTIPYMFNQYMAFSEYAGIPHDNNSPYHFYYVAFQVTMFVSISMVSPAYEIILFYLQLMAKVEMQVLGDKLSAIMNTEIFTDDLNVASTSYDGSQGTGNLLDYKSDEFNRRVKKLDMELKQWIGAHQKALRFCDNLKRLVHAEVTCRYLYMGGQLSMSVIGLRKMISGKGGLNNVALLVVVTGVNLWLILLSVRISDQIYELSTRVADKAFSASWYLYPVNIQKMLAQIMCRCKTRPVVLRGCLIIADNTANFMKVIQMAYNVMSVVLPMATD